MTVMAMMQILFRMSLQGSIIIGSYCSSEWYLEDCGSLYRYCVLLWGIVFFYLIFPWKIWQYADTAQGTLYWFTVSLGKVTVITEEQLTA
jgi:hypothetical protein